MFSKWENGDIKKLDDDKIASHIKEEHIDKFKVDINFKDDNPEYSTPALILAAKMGLYNTLKVLLDNGADINIRGNIENTALMSAAFCNHHNIVLLLIQRGADINAVDDGGINAIDYAMMENNENCLSAAILFENGLNPSNEL
jgi:ankyrin repeat protein